MAHLSSQNSSKGIVLAFVARMILDILVKERKSLSAKKEINYGNMLFFVISHMGFPHTFLSYPNRVGLHMDFE